MIRALGLAVAVASLPAPALADTQVQLPTSRAQIVLPDSFTRTELPGVVLACTHPRGTRLVITRTDAPNADAWSDQRSTRDAYADAVERGLAASIPGFKRSRRVLDKRVVPTLDLEATREGGATVLVRALLFRTYALTLAIEIPAKGDIAVARHLAATFAPPAP